MTSTSEKKVFTAPRGKVKQSWAMLIASSGLGVHDAEIRLPELAVVASKNCDDAKHKFQLPT